VAVPKAEGTCVPVIVAGVVFADRGAIA
jgi:hypothetical protein